MVSHPKKHFRKTAALAKRLRPSDVFQWLVTEGYFPEPYVLPPCFVVQARRPFGKAVFSHSKSKFKPKLSESLAIHFPRTDWTDRTFGIMDPEIHSDIALALARNWKAILNAMFTANNRVYSYSFPIPIDANHSGTLGSLRAGRMIYEFLEMAEHDLAAEAFRYRYVLRTDVKNFYPAIYTHSIAWALHGKQKIRKGSNRYNFQLVGNRLDKLFQNANDGCTNGIPIGPAVSDLVAEIVLAGVDRELSSRLKKDGVGDEVLIVRFKDDYRILARTQEDGRSAIKQLQSALREYRLELNEEKTESHAVPDGLFRKWVSQYHAVNPRPKAFYTFRRFKEVYLSVVAIDRENPGTGVIDRFLADLVRADGRLRMSLTPRALPKVVSLVLMLATLRTKAFPKALAIVEVILKSKPSKRTTDVVADHLVDLLGQLTKKETENTYPIVWILYFIRSNGLEGHLKVKYKLANPVARAVYTSRFSHFSNCHGFKVFQGVKAASKRTSLLRHLDVFRAG